MLLLFLSIIGTLAEPECPKFSVAFDFQSCDPNKRSQCPGGFTCRIGNDTAKPDRLFYLCCDNSVMTVEDWFTEGGLVPQVFPQGPQSKIKSVQLTPVESNTEFPSVHIGDEVVVLSYPSYVTGMVDKVTFGSQPFPGGYLHFMTIVDPGYRPTAIFFNYNQPSTGMATVSTSNPSMSTRVAAYVDNSTTVPVRDSYRAQYVVLVFRTPSPITLGQGNNNNRILTNSSPYEQGATVESTDPAAMMNGCADVTCLLSNTTLGRDLGQPIAGTLFYLTTRRTLFDTSAQAQQDWSSSTSLLPAILTALLIHIL